MIEKSVLVPLPPSPRRSIPIKFPWVTRAHILYVHRSAIWDFLWETNFQIFSSLCTPLPSKSLFSEWIKREAVSFSGVYLEHPLVSSLSPYLFWFLTLGAYSALPIFSLFAFRLLVIPGFKHKGQIDSQTPFWTVTSLQNLQCLCYFPVLYQPKYSDLAVKLLCICSLLVGDSEVWLSLPSLLGAPWEPESCFLARIHCSY